MAEPSLVAEETETQAGVTRDTLDYWTMGAGMPTRRRGRLCKARASEADEWLSGGFAQHGSGVEGNPSMSRPLLHAMSEGQRILIDLPIPRRRCGCLAVPLQSRTTR